MRSTIQTAVMVLGTRVPEPMPELALDVYRQGRRGPWLDMEAST